ncbi:glycosyltransferase family 4 protein [bacterium]|nr:glycosyltransferase family 4 protein [bacterium]
MGKNIKVLHIITRLIVGGAQENTMYTIEGLIRDGWSADLLSGPTKGPEGEIVKKIIAKKIPLYMERSLIRNLNIIEDIRAFIHIYGFIKKGKYNIVHTHSSKAGILGRWAAFFARVPIIIHTIHGLPFHKYQNPLIRYFYVFSEWITAIITTKILSVSSNIIDQALAYGIGKRSQYSVVRSGLNIDDFLLQMGKGKAVRKEFNIGQDRFVLGTLARLFYLKGHKYIIAIANSIIEAHGNIVFLFIGDGILKENFLKQIEKLGLREYFVFTGLIQPEKVPAYLDCCDVIIHPSLREGLPRVVPQAFLLEKPVIAFDVDGTSEVVIKGKTGFLNPPKDLQSLKKNINYVINNHSEAKNMARKGKKLILKEFTIEKMVSDIENIYNRFI